MDMEYVVVDVRRAMPSGQVRILFDSKISLAIVMLDSVGLNVNFGDEIMYVFCIFTEDGVVWTFMNCTVHSALFMVPKHGKD